MMMMMAGGENPVHGSHPIRRARSCQALHNYAEKPHIGRSIPLDD
jgi:hypothetical protein